MQQALQVVLVAALADPGDVASPESLLGAIEQAL
jgi:hypothetical protein